MIPNTDWAYIIAGLSLLFVTEHVIFPAAEKRLSADRFKQFRRATGAIFLVLGTSALAYNLWLAFR